MQVKVFAAFCCGSLTCFLGEAAGNSTVITARGRPRTRIKMNKLAGILLLMLVLGPVSGQLIQKKDKGDAGFSTALQAFRQEKYTEAMSLFAPLARDYSNQERSVYAHFFYASAAQHLDQDKEGWNMLQQLLSRYPGWAQKDEVYYLAGLFNFKLKNYYRAIDYLQRIGNSSFQKDVAGLKQRFLSELTDLGTLKGLHKQFPNDRMVGAYLVKAINSRPSPARSDVELAKNLTSRFKLAEGKEGAPAGDQDAKSKPKTRSADKKHHDVAVLLPFRVDAFAPGARSRSNQYVFDYYQGLLMAQKALKKEKIEVKLHPFDIANTLHSVTNLAEKAEFQNADLILGPLYAETSEEAAEYSRSSGVPVVNPLSTDAKLLTNRYPHYFLAHPSLGLQASQVVQVAKSIDGAVKAVIYFGESSKDSALADFYAAEVKKAGGEVLAMKRIGGTAEAMAPVMTESAGTAKPSHVVLFSTDARSGRAFLNQMRGAGYERTPVIATATAFDRYNTDFSIYGRDIYLLDTDYVDYDRTEVKTFQYDYYMAFNTLPSLYSYQAYDHLMFLGRKLEKHKSKIGDGLSQSSFIDRQGYFLGGFDFGNSRENSVFAIRKYQGNAWVPAN